MPRYRLTLEYDGRPFVGWQRQANGPSVQEALETAAARLDGAPVTVNGAGRTDAGVHATGQAAHLDLTRPLAPDAVRDALNFHLKPAPIAVLEAAAAAPDFHARFDAGRRTYRYVIVNRRAPLTFDKGLVWRVPQRLDERAMHAAAQTLVGRHDFSTFRAAECQAKSPVKTLETIRVARHGDRIEMLVQAPSFLHRQVRSFAGSLAQVGRGAWGARDLAAALAARNRAACGPVAPPDGLYLTKVEYALEAERSVADQ
ncbi:MAG: tRNA pseudouridine(38-40) synthase TruA [Pseudomonadota bacterium]